MKVLLLIAISMVLSCAAYAQEQTIVVSACVQFDRFYAKMLVDKVAQKEAVAHIARLRQAMQDQAVQQTSYHQANAWTFPLKGYNYRAVGGTNGNGYTDKGYRFLDGNRHTAHPAHDIFIRDKNQDCLDDVTGSAIDVLSIEDGWVVACSKVWEPDSKLRGGKYVLLYHPENGTFSYYAHNALVTVSPGDHVKQGQKIAEVGRTGLNAYKNRSPTHLHFSAFKLVGGLPVPFNPYLQLKKAK